MSRCAIFTPHDREFYAGLDLGWSKQLRLAHVYPEEKTAMRTIYEWRQLGNEMAFKLVWIHWRIYNAKGQRVCDRGSIADCKRLLQKYATGEYPGWALGPYRVVRVATLPINDARGSK